MRNLLLVLLFVPFMVQAETPQEKGLVIAIETDNRDKGWEDSFAGMN